MNKLILVGLLTFSMNVNVLICSSPVQMDNHQEFVGSISLLILNSILNKCDYVGINGVYERAKIIESIQKVSIFDAAIKIKQEDCNGEELVIILTDVYGTVEEFEGRDILENEKKLLKFILIKHYLDHVKKVEKSKKSGQKSAASILDSHTKISVSPQFVRVSQGMYFGEPRYSNEIKGMQFSTIFTAAEFDGLIRQFFMNQQKI